MGPCGSLLYTNLLTYLLTYLYETAELTESVRYLTSETDETPEPDEPAGL